MFEGGNKGISRMFHASFLKRQFQECFKKVSGVFQGCCEGVLSQFQGYFKEVLNMIKGSLRAV